MTSKQRTDSIERFIRAHQYADLRTLAVRFGGSLSTVRRALDQLEERGFITRRRCTQDRRVVHLEITGAGKRLAKSLSPRIVQFWNTTMDGFTAEEFAQLVSLMTRLMTRLEAQPLAGTEAEQ